MAASLSAETSDIYKEKGSYSALRSPWQKRQPGGRPSHQEQERLEKEWKGGLPSKTHSSETYYLYLAQTIKQLRKAGITRACQ